MDLNCDIGELPGELGRSIDSRLLESVSSANIACGLHAGNAAIILQTMLQARARGIAIGAHVSFDDREGFGRRKLTVPPDILQAQLFFQLGAIGAIARSVGAHVSYVKPHGALYNQVMVDEALAAVVVNTVSAYSSSLAILGLPGSALCEETARAGLRYVNEAFPDRAYSDDGTLLSRDQPGSVIHDPEIVARRAREFTQGFVITESGKRLAIQAESLCLHGDNMAAAEAALLIRYQLEQGGIDIRPFISTS